jgi:thiamine biosynthesis lipoprotein
VLRRRGRILFLLVLLTVEACSPGNEDSNMLAISGATMGTQYSIKVAGAQVAKQRESLQGEIDGILDGINRVMSTWIENSELSLLNRNSGSDWVPVSEDLWTVLQEAHRVSRISNGAFDVTVGPLVNLWGFGPGEYTADMIPDSGAIEQTLRLTGYEKIAYLSGSRKVMKKDPGLYIDLSAIAKGFAVDKLAAYLESGNYNNYMIEIGGEIRVRGRPGTERGWRVGIEQPLTDRRAVHTVIELRDMAMASSGDYRNFFEMNGKYYSHTINPRTGRPVQHDLASVTVLHESAMTADALATAYTVLGPRAGVELAGKLQTPACFITRNEDSFSEHYTGNFEQFIIRQTRP